MRRLLNIKIIMAETAIIILLLSMAFAITVHAEKVNEMDNKQKYYTSIYIESGETLWHLAELYADDDYYLNKFEYIKELKKMNNLKSDQIKQGTYLLVTYYK